MAERIQLPTKAQLDAISSVAALGALADDLERSIEQMETQLEFLDDTDDGWASRATNALALHRYTRRLIGKRLAKLRPAAPKQPGAKRQPDEMDELTETVLKCRPKVDIASIASVADIDATIEWLAVRINAVTSDREDEVARAAYDRDEGFLASTGNALREMRALRQQLQNRRGEITRAEKMAERAKRDPNREQLFIDAAREVLDRATFMAIWDRVDRMERFQTVEAANG